MGLYVVEHHIEAVSDTAQSCKGIAEQLGQITSGVEVPPLGWAQNERAARHLDGLMHMFSEVDLGFAFPADAETRASSLQHLADAEAAFGGDDDELRAVYEQQYGAFDVAAALFYRTYAHAFGRIITPEVVKRTNELIDPQVKEGARLLQENQVSHRVIFPGLVDSLTKSRSDELKAPERRED